MRSSAILFCLVLTLIGISPAVGARSSQQSSPRSAFIIVAFGTSLTEGSAVADERWTDLLRNVLRQRYTDVDIVVINAGIGGSTTRERLLRLQSDVLDRHPDLVIHDFAANDATYEPQRHVKVEEFVRNIEWMHHQIVSKAGAAEIYWPQTPIINEKHIWRSQSLYLKAGGLDQYVAAYRMALAKESHKLHVPFVDMDAIFRRQFREKDADYYLLPDGIHHRKAGSQLVAASLLPAVENVIDK